uniref:HMG box domain-containing protein n=1 Tax=viral metagenome TaxID=1070528 RepID=A0A6C0CH96_9ZZZZ
MLTIVLHKPATTVDFLAAEQEIYRREIGFDLFKQGCRQFFSYMPEDDLERVALAKWRALPQEERDAWIEKSRQETRKLIRQMQLGFQYYCSLKIDSEKLSTPAEFVQKLSEDWANMTIEQKQVWVDDFLTKSDKAPPMSAFVYFTAERRPELKLVDPNGCFSDQNKILRAEWKAKSIPERQKWIDLADRDRERYEGELNASSAQ